MMREENSKEKDSKLGVYLTVKRNRTTGGELSQQEELLELTQE